MTSSGPVFCLLLGVSSDYAQPITGQVTEVTCPVIGRAQPELTLSKRQKTGPGLASDDKVGMISTPRLNHILLTIYCSWAADQASGKIHLGTIEWGKVRGRLDTRERVDILGLAKFGKLVKLVRDDPVESVGKDDSPFVIVVSPPLITVSPLESPLVRLPLGTGLGSVVKALRFGDVPERLGVVPVGRYGVL